MKRRNVPSKAELAMRLRARCSTAKLDRGQVRDLAVVHLQNLDAIHRGEGNEEVLRSTIGGIYTWQGVAQRLGVGVDEMQAQHSLGMALWARYARTGKVCFACGEYELAKLGIYVMDDLIEAVDLRTALEAAEHSERRLKRLVLADTATPSDRTPTAARPQPL